MNNQPSRFKRIAYILAMVLPAIITAIFFLTWVLDIEIADPILDGLRIEALGALLTAGFIVLMDNAFNEFIQNESEANQPDLEAELRAVRQELQDLKHHLTPQSQNEPPA
jgi:hypothetical protein